MVIKVFISGISASKEVKKHQLRAQFLLDSYKIKYELVDISDPLCEDQREKMLAVAKRRTENVSPQPPQFFNGDDYCGDYEDLETSNDNDRLFDFLQLQEDITIENGDNYDENDVFKPEQGIKNDENYNEVNNEEKNETNDDEEQVKTEVCEQITVNGVVYDIPPDRKITIGGRVINVDELMATEGEEIDIDDVDEKLKEKMGTKAKHEQNDKDEDEDEDDEEE